MEYLYSDDKIWAEDGEGKIVAEIDLPAAGEGLVNITHTYVDRSLRGRGVAEELTELAAEKIRKENKKAVLSCSYAVRWFELHPEQRDILSDPGSE